MFIIIAVRDRFTNSVEEIDNRKMADDPTLIRLADHAQTFFVLVEIKTNLCAINGPWSDPQVGNMQRVIQRLGFAEEKEIEAIAEEMYRNLRWESDKYVLQYISVGKRVNGGCRALRHNPIQHLFYVNKSVHNITSSV